MAHDILRLVDDEDPKAFGLVRCYQPVGQVLQRGAVAALGLDAEAGADAAEQGIGRFEIGNVEEVDLVMLIIVQDLGDGLEQGGLAAADWAI